MFYSSSGWESWEVEFKPVIPEGMSLIFDDDLLFEDERGPRPAAVVNRWACQLPTDKVPSENSWPTYVRVVREWMEFGAEYGVSIFDGRDLLKALLSAYSVHRASGPLKFRFKATTWNQHMAILGRFYDWAVDNQYAVAVPFTYAYAQSVFDGVVRDVKVNNARRRVPKEHVTVKYLADDFEDLFLKGLARLQPDGVEESGYRGREMARNAAVGGFVFASGPRKQEFTYVLACEVPPLPRRATELPVLFPLAAKITKGSKFRNTWIGYRALAELHNYLTFERAAATQGSRWTPPAKWGEPLIVTEADIHGGRVDGSRVQWADLGPRERRRLVAPDGGSMLLSVTSSGAPFTAWNTVFERTADRVRERYEPRFPHVWPHRGRHTFAMRTMTSLVRGDYARRARAVDANGTDAALALYLTSHEPLLILRDLLGHTSVLTTEKYLRRLDTTRIFAELHQFGEGADSPGMRTADREAAAEFDDDGDEAEI